VSRIIGKHLQIFKAFADTLRWSPFEFFCEELECGIPTWAVGRKFNAGNMIVPLPGKVIKLSSNPF
jgi:phospholipase A2